MVETPSFVPVQVVSALPGAEAVDRVGGVACPGEGPEGERSVEIVLPDGTRLRVAENIGAAALRRLLLVLRG